ncbi:MAG: 50S ribosomal protein L25 [Spirochaetia bacterium]|nr:50S ribosomal protein L25 [Spirochaetia bacterium]
MQEMIIQAEERKVGEKVSAIRKQGMIPAVIYNHGKTQHLKINEKLIQKIFASGISEAQLWDIEVGGKKEKSFIKDYQTHPVTSQILHMDFFRITSGEKIKTHIPIHVEGKSEGEKAGGMLEILLHSIELEILPKDLMPAITLDISKLQMGDGIHVNDLDLPASARIIVEGNPMICHIAQPAKAKAEDEAKEGAAEAAAPETK